MTEKRDASLSLEWVTITDIGTVCSNKKQHPE